MPSLRIIALDGSLNNDFGWAIPIVEEVARFYLLGETLHEGLELAELPRLAQSQEMTLLHPVDCPFDAKREGDDLRRVKDLLACRSFGAPVMGFYWHEETAKQESIDVKRLTREYTPLKMKVSSELEIRLLPVSALIRCLREVVRTMCRSFVRALAENIRDYPTPFESERSPAFASNGRLRWLADMAYRLAPDSGWAKEAIAQKTLLLLLGDHPASVPTWLSAIAPYWRHPSALQYWRSAAHGVWAAAQSLALQWTGVPSGLSGREGRESVRRSIKRTARGENLHREAPGPLERITESDSITEAGSITEGGPSIRNQ